MCSVIAELEAAREALSDHIQLEQSLNKMVNNLRSNFNQQQQQVRDIIYIEAIYNINLTPALRWFVRDVYSKHFESSFTDAQAKVQ